VGTTDGVLIILLDGPRSAKNSPSGAGRSGLGGVGGPGSVGSTYYPQ
jgi:hypothetical protein